MNTQSKVVKMRKIEVHSQAEFIDTPTDWRKAEGVIAKRTETNSALADRDYSIPCSHGSYPLMIVEGYHIWWCYTHNQPLSKCDHARWKEGFKLGVKAALQNDW